MDRGQMVVERSGIDPEAVPVEDIGVLILDHPGIVHTQGLLAACIENNAAVLVCDSKHLPAAMFLPFKANSLHAKVVALQSTVSVPIKKRLWKSIVRAKIIGQAETLRLAGKDPGPVFKFAERVRSGDPDNIEAQVARFYWQRLFGPVFRRDREEKSVNAFLNYGYAVVRGAIARAIVGAGLHPSLGIHHHNQYNNFCLADDLLEPFRPIVDLVAYSIVEPENNAAELDKESRRKLLEILNYTSKIGGRTLPLMSAFQSYAASIRAVMAGEAMEPEIPALS
ncbi:CRISPR-associated endonuclease Cas1 [uncultured bacterium]|nr:CRISPR-associated endonuclease Cas1 [uncultured bacterium]